MRHLLLLFALLAVVALWAGLVEAAQPERLSYDEFLQKVQAGQVKSVSLGPLDYLEGVYSQGNAEKEFFSQRPLEPASDPLLTELLEKHKVSVVHKAQAESSSMDRLVQFVPFVLLLLVPSVLLVFVLIYVVRINNKINQVVIH